MNHFAQVFVNFQKRGKSKDKAGTFNKMHMGFDLIIGQKLPNSMRCLPHGLRMTLPERREQILTKTRFPSS
jgi:hypothetical protein